MDQGFEKYKECMEYIQSHPEYRLRYEAYFKNVTDEANRLSTARREGYLEGEEKMMKRLVGSLLERGYSPTYMEKELHFDPTPYINSLYSISLNRKKE